MTTRRCPVFRLPMLGAFMVGLVSLPAAELIDAPSPLPAVVNHSTVVTPASFLALKEDGEVVLACVIDEQGVPTAIRTVSTTHAELETVAHQVLAARRYAITERDGKPVRIEATLTFPFGAKEVTELDQRPKPLRQVPPQYPHSLRRAGVGGRVVVMLDVNEAGAPCNVQVAEDSHVELGRSAVHAIQQWQFEVGTVAGRPVSFSLKIPLVFEPDAPPPQQGRSHRSANRQPLLVITVDLDTTEPVLSADLASRVRVLEWAPVAAQLQGRLNLDRASRTTVRFSLDRRGTVQTPSVTFEEVPGTGEAILGALRQSRFETTRGPVRDIELICHVPPATP